MHAVHKNETEKQIVPNDVICFVSPYIAFRRCVDVHSCRHNETKNLRKRDISKGVDHAFSTFGEGILRNHLNQTECAKFRGFLGLKVLHST